MDRHGEGEVADPGEHVDDGFTRSETAHPHPLPHVPRREHHPHGVELEDDPVLPVDRLGPQVTCYQLPLRLPEGAGDASVQEDRSAPGVDLEEGVSDPPLEVADPGVDLDGDDLPQDRPPLGEESPLFGGDPVAEESRQVWRGLVELGIFLEDDLSSW